MCLTCSLKDIVSKGPPCKQMAKNNSCFSSIKRNTSLAFSVGFFLFFLNFKSNFRVYHRLVKKSTMLQKLKGLRYMYSCTHIYGCDAPSNDVRCICSIFKQESRDQNCTCGSMFQVYARQVTKKSSEVKC